MRIIVWGINYTPEETGIGPFNTGMCEWLAARGHQVEMVTTFPYYPAWRKDPRDQGRLFRTDRIAGVVVRRCWHFVPAKVTSMKRIIHEATFIGFSFLRLLFLRRPDVLVVVSPPLPLGIPARLLGFFWRRPYVFHVQDLQPDAAVGLGMLRPGVFTRVLYALESCAYRGAWFVSGICGGMLRAFGAKGVGAERVCYFPNWMLEGSRDAESGTGADPKASFCAANGLNPDDVLVVYSGNVGAKQGLGAILDAAALPDTHGMRWVIAGEGAGKASLAERVKLERLENVTLLPLLPAGRFVDMLRAADVCLVTQQKGSGQFFFPSKLLTLLAHGCQVVAVADETSELAVALAEGNFGMVIRPGDARGFVAAVKAVAVADERERARNDENGRRWLAQFDRARVLEAFEAKLLAVAGKR